MCDLYYRNSFIEKNLSRKGVKSLVTNNKGEADVLWSPGLNINYINLIILDIRKNNEIFFSLLKF